MQITPGTLERLSEYLRAVGKGYAGPFVREEDTESTPEERAIEAIIPIPPITAQGPSPAEALLHQWGIVEAALCTTETPEERWRILVRWQSDIVSRNSSSSNTDPAAQIAHFLLWRVWLADEAVLALMQPTERDELLRSIAKNDRFRRLFLLVPGKYLHFVDRVALASAPGLFEQRDVHSIGPWLAAGIRDPALLQPEPLLSPHGSDMTGLVNLAWPPFAHEAVSLSEAACRMELHWHLVALQQLHQRGLPIRPNSLQTSLFERGWLNRQTSYIPDLLALLQYLLLWPIAPYPDAQALLPEKRFHIFDAVLLDDKEAISTFLTALAQCSPRLMRDGQTWWTGLLIGLYYKDRQVCALWTRMLLQTDHACNDVRLLEYLRSDAESLLWDEEVVHTEAIIRLFGNALNVFSNMGKTAERRYEELAQALHHQLCGRTDYPYIVSELRRTPTVPPRASDELAVYPSADYLWHLRVVAVTTASHRDNTVRQLLQRAETAKTIEVRNRSLVDAAYLLMGREVTDKNWPCTALLSLQRPEVPPVDIDPTLWDQLWHDVTLAQQDTPCDFTDLMLYFTESLTDDDAYSDTYDAWFYRYMPYITEHLSASNANRYVVQARLERLVALCEDPALAEEVRSLGQRRVRLWIESNRP